jgi:hypothetical protein
VSLPYGTIVPFCLVPRRGAIVCAGMPAKGLPGR